METNVNYTIVGGFVLLLIIAIILGIVWLSSGFSFELYQTYKVYMQESVSGLNIDSPVEYNGVEVGTVKSIDLNQLNPKLVELLLKIKNNTPITKGTVATLNTRGVTGITFIALKDTGKNLTPLVAKENQRYPVIVTAPSIFVRLDTALSKVSTNLEKVTESIQSVLDKENLLLIKQTMHHLEQVTSALANNSYKLESILKNTAKASQQFTPLIQTSITTMKTIESQTLPSFYQLLNHFDEMIATLSQVSTQVKENPSVLIRGTLPGVLGPGEK